MNNQVLCCGCVCTGADSDCHTDKTTDFLNLDLKSPVGMQLQGRMINAMQDNKCISLIEAIGV